MTDYRSNNHVHGWLKDVPGYRENYRNQREMMQQDVSKKIVVPQKERPSSLASISSADSVNLDDLINANFTTDMDDETDLSALATLELDDSNEDFWKMDNMFNHHIPIAVKSTEKPKTLLDSSNRSRYESEEESGSYNTSAEDLHESPPYNNTTEPSNFVGPLDIHHTTPAADYYDMRFSNTHPSSPTCPLKRSDRFGSFSSEHSLNSVSTVVAASRNNNAQRQNMYPSASTSTSSVSSHSTSKTSHSSYLSRPSITKSDSSTTRLNGSSRRPSLVSSISENTSAFASSGTRLPSRSVSQIGLARRATHIPTLSSTGTKAASLLPSPTKTGPTPQRTKSTASLLAHKSSTGNLSRSASRIGQPSARASHIPSPSTKRSTTSLGMSSIFSPQKPQQKYTSEKESYSRPSTSMSTASKPSPTKSCLRMPSVIRTPTSSKSSGGLKAPSSRTLYK
ncbi:hypothetical protein [Parasitella parasitica]|uniref:Uncharacterized protein n=1 Tax=Parasitella parasitica TaxID=35722 RepID=A0A0B7NXR9_9FUNG|nr:hypothetical protein [Parasitella parasitica]